MFKKGTVPFKDFATQLKISMLQIGTLKKKII